jgi:hypothetical protein
MFRDSGAALEKENGRELPVIETTEHASPALRKTEIGTFVLGMLRSGTSATARAINLLGVPGCVSSDLKGAGPFNPKGHWESGSVHELNSMLLRQIGRDWFCPPPVELVREGLFITSPEQARRTFKAVHPTTQWVWKDPLTCLTLPFWLDTLSVSPVFVLVVRNPLEVAQSMWRRWPAFTKEVSLALWERYMRHALTHIRSMPVFIMRYEDMLKDSEGWCTEISSFLTSAGVTLPSASDGRAVVSAFLERDLYHAQYGWRDLVNDPAVSPVQRKLYELVYESAGPTQSWEPPPLLPPEREEVEECIVKFSMPYDLPRVPRKRRGGLQ